MSDTTPMLDGVCHSSPMLSGAQSPKLEDRRPTAGNLNLSPIPEPDQNKLSTFNGVFVPVFFSIFGVVLYTRMGWIVGNAGIGAFLLILVIGEVMCCRETRTVT